MRMTENDRKVLQFLDKYKAARTNTLYELFYPSLRTAQYNLKKLYDNRKLKRDRDDFTSQYYYYFNKPRQLRHSLLLTDFYRELHKIATIKVFEKEFTIGDIRADALVGYRYNNANYIAFVEVELSNRPDVKKYEKLKASGEYRKYLTTFPLIFFITDRPIPKTDLTIIRINEDITNLKGVL